MKPLSPFFALLLLAIAPLHIHAVADEVTGGPGYARAAMNTPIDDDFSGGTLERRYQLIGRGAEPTGSAYEQDGKLYLTAGPTTSESKLEVALQRYYFLHQSFNLRVDAGISSESEVLGTAGLAIVSPTSPNDTLTRIGLALTFDPVAHQAFVFSNVPEASGTPANQSFTFSTDSLYTLELDYDAATQTMLLAVPDAGYSRLIVMSTYVDGFQILLSSQTESIGGLPAQSKAIFDNLLSNLTADPYLVSHSPLTFGGAVYDDALPSDSLGGNPVYFALGQSLDSLSRVALDDTWLQLDGQASYNAALVSIVGAWHSTIYTAADCASISSKLPPGAVIDQFIFNALVASGWSNDYLWNDSPATVGADCGLGAGAMVWAVDPSSASAGTQVTLYGYGFGATAGTLSLGSVTVMPNTWSNERITFNVPTELAGGKTTVTIEAAAGTDSVEFVVSPSITSIYPQEVTSGSVFWLTGTGFGEVGDEAVVWLDAKTPNILSRGVSQIAATVPDNANPGPVTVSTTVNGAGSNGVQVTVLPYVASLSFSMVRNEPVLRVGGSNFGEFRNDGSFGVLLDGAPVEIRTWDTHGISAVLPEKLTNGDHSLVVIAEGEISNDKRFVFTRNKAISGYLEAATSPGNSWKGNALEGRLLVKTESGAIILPPGETPIATLSEALVEPQLRGVLRGIGAQTIEGDNRGNLKNIYRIKFEKDNQIEDAWLKLKLVRSVVDSAPLVKAKFDYVPIDLYNQIGQYFTGYPSTLYSRSYTWDYPQTRLDKAWDIFQGSPSVRIGILDTGVESHPDLNARRWSTGRDSGVSTDGSDHGTNVASVCCAAWDNRAAAGVDGHATFTSYVKGDVWDDKNQLYDAVADGMDIVNMSFHFESLDTLSRSVLRDGINWAYANDVLLISTVDNGGGSDGCDTTVYPAEWGEVLSVNNYQDSDKCGYTWANNDIMAPGGGNPKLMIATFSSLGENFDYLNIPYRSALGTSFAAPFVSGVASLIKGWNPMLTANQIKGALTSTSRGDPGQYNGGMIDAYGALLYAEGLNVGKLDWDEAFNEVSGKASDKVMSIGHGWKKFSVDVQNRGDGILSYEVDILTACGLFGTACFQTDFNDEVVTSKARYYSHGYQAASQAQYYGYLSPEKSVSVPIYVDTEGWADQDEITTIICVYTSGEDVKYAPSDKPDPLSCVTYTVKMIECFTSVALEHTELAPEVDMLREFRDVSVKPKIKGKDLIAKYYRLSPSIVDVMQNDQVAKEGYIDLVRRFKETLRAQIVSDVTPILLTNDMTAALTQPFTQNDANALKDFAERLARDSSISSELSSLIPAAKIFVDLNVGRARSEVLQDLMAKGL